MKRIARFLAAGAAGFLVDAGVTLALIHLTPAGPFVARPIAIAAAMATTWAINRTVTFQSSRATQSGGEVASEAFRYGVVGSVTAVFNYGLYASLLANFPVLQPLVALVISSAAAMLFSFFGYSRFAFRDHHRPG